VLRFTNTIVPVSANDGNKITLVFRPSGPNIHSRMHGQLDINTDDIKQRVVLASNLTNTSSAIVTNEAYLQLDLLHILFDFQ